MARWFVSLLVVGGLLAGALPALAQDGEQLTETFTSEDGSLSFNYPEGWVVEEQYVPGSLILANSPESLAAILDNDETLTVGQLWLMILTPSAAGFLFPEAASAKTIDGAIEALMLELDEVDGNANAYSEPKELVLGESPALIFQVTGKDSEGIGVGIDFDGTFVFVLVATALGEYDQYADTVLAILGTLVYTKPEGSVAFTNNRGNLSLEYPAGWLALEAGLGSVGVTSGASLLSDSATLAPGDVLVIILSPLALRDLYGFADMTPIEDVAAEFADSFLSVDDTELAEPVDVTIGDHEGVRIDYTSPKRDGFVLVLDFAGQSLLIRAETAPGELADQEAAIMAVVESITYTP